jgi:hypothetical protein
MTYTLSPEQSALWQEGNWSAYRIEEDILEHVDRQRIQDPQEGRCDMTP